MTTQSDHAVGERSFEPEDFAFTAKLLRTYVNENQFHVICSNNLNIILAALDAASSDLAP